MPKVTYKDTVIECSQGERLRDVLKRAGLAVHNGESAWFNCKGFGTCGTCAVQIEGEVAPKNARESWRLDFPPHDASTGLRLACQIRVHHDLVVTKHAGFWGHVVHEDT